MPPPDSAEAEPRSYPSAALHLPVLSPSVPTRFVEGSLTRDLRRDRLVSSCGRHLTSRRTLMSHTRALRREALMQPECHKRIKEPAGEPTCAVEARHKSRNFGNMKSRLRDSRLSTYSTLSTPTRFAQQPDSLSLALMRQPYPLPVQVSRPVVDISSEHELAPPATPAYLWMTSDLLATLPPAHALFPLPRAGDPRRMHLIV